MFTDRAAKTLIHGLLLILLCHIGEKVLPTTRTSEIFEINQPVAYRGLGSYTNTTSDLLRQTVIVGTITNS
jgi:hypothetical protein